MNERHGFETPEKCSGCPYIQQRLAEMACAGNVVLNQTDQRLAVRSLSFAQRALQIELEETVRQCPGRDEISGACGRTTQET